MNNEWRRYAYPRADAPIRRVDGVTRFFRDYAVLIVLSATALGTAFTLGYAANQPEPSRVVCDTFEHPDEILCVEGDGTVLATFEVTP